MPIRLLIADPHPLIREVLRLLLAETEIEVAAEADTTELAVQLAQDRSLDVALLDLSWSDQPTGHLGLELLRRMIAVRADLPVVIFAVYDSDRYVEECRKLGARSYVVKGTTADSLLSAIRAAAAGGPWTVYRPRLAESVSKTGAQAARMAESTMPEPWLS